MWTLDPLLTELSSLQGQHKWSPPVHISLCLVFESIILFFEVVDGGVDGFTLRNQKTLLLYYKKKNLDLSPS